MNLLAKICLIVILKINYCDKGRGPITRNNVDILIVFQVFPFFSVIRFKNVQCSGTNGQFGTCFSRKSCSDAGGVASGSCARNWGTCCISKYTGVYQVIKEQYTDVTAICLLIVKITLD